MENLQKKERTYERHDVENTPFSIIKELPEGKCRITIGNNIMSEKEFNSISEAKLYIDEKPWKLLLNSMALMAENVILLNNKQIEQTRKTTKN